MNDIAANCSGQPFHDHGESVLAVVARRRPARIVYGPNYWQWFSHHKQHQTLPPEIAHCQTQLDLIKHLGLDVFSRNVYCDQRRCWFGGLAETVYRGIEVEQHEQAQGDDLVFERRFHTRAGTLHERQRYVFRESTLVQEKFLIDDYARQLDALEEFLRARSWRFCAERYKASADEVGGQGLVVAGELHSPLKMLHFLLGPAETTYLLVDEPRRAAELLAFHEAAQLDLVRQMAAAGVRVMMSMDNLDAVFHTPAYLENYAASYYEKASRICHEHQSLLFIHACGRQKANLKRIASYGVDGLEGVAFPPLGDVELDEAMRLSGDHLIITGGISAMETDQLRTRDDVDRYVQNLCGRMRPYAHRFVLSASCATPYNAPWDTLRYFRDAWLRYGLT
jgi:uroporphyrinogen-III decarboxylase